MSKQNNYEVTFSSPEYKVLGDYLKAIDSPGFPSNYKNTRSGKTITNTDGSVDTDNSVDWDKYAIDFCGYVDDYGKSNLDHIKARFVLDDAILDSINNLVNSNKHLLLPIKPSIRFAIPRVNIDKATLLTQGLQVTTNEGAFKAQALYNLERDIRYTPVNKKVSSNKLSGDLKEFYPDMTIWLWCRSLSPQQTNNPDDSLQGQIFDITRFVENITTSMTKNGGNFQIQLAPIVCLRDPTSGYWAIDSAYTHDSITDDLRKEFYSESQINKIVSGTDVSSYEVSRNTFLFHNSINTNDVIFIRYETLEIEALQRIKDSQIGLNNNFIDKNELPNKIYDMIGLVDNNRLNISPNNNEISVQISGRDLSKLFIEDGTYFYALENEQGTLNFAGGTTAKNEFTRRVVNDNALLYLGLYFNNSIEKILGFIIQQLSTITVVPNNLFSAYAGVINASKQSKNQWYLPSSVAEKINQQSNTTADQRSKTFQLSQDSKQTLAKRTNQAKIDIENVQTLIKSFRKTNGLTAVTPTGQPDDDTEKAIVEAAYQKMYSFVNLITTPDTKSSQVLAIYGNGNTAVKVTGNTTPSGSTINGWSIVTDTEFQTGASKIPDIFSVYENALFKLGTSGNDRNLENVGIINKIWSIIQNEKIITKDLTEDEVPANGIWQIIDLVIDRGVSSRRLLDSSISSANGSLLNFIRKACQEPFVEFFMDTYGDKYHLIVRKPPFDKDGMTKYISGNVYTENIDATTSSDKSKIQVNGNNQLNTVVVRPTTPLVMDIEAIDVIQENLYFDDSDVYSWYHFVPKGSFFGNAQQYSLAYIPAIFFDEYAEIWGSKPLDIVNNYTPYVPSYGKVDNTLDAQTKQAFYDLKYMVETNQYNPFVRKGTIVMNRDRRLKIGNPVRYKPTGEIFWIDSVSHSSSITVGSVDATTTIQVSRGMVEKFINGITGAELNTMFNTKSVSFTPTKRFSYFDIIKTDLILDKTKMVATYKDSTTNVATNTGNVVNTITTQSTGQTSQAGIEFIKDHEGAASLVAKPDTKGNYQIGYGANFNTDGTRIKKGQQISLQGAEDLLKFQLGTYENDVKFLHLPHLLLQNQFDALVDFAYNAGGKAFGYVDKVTGSTLRAAIINFQNGAIDAGTLSSIWSRTAITSQKTKTSPDIVNPVLVKRRIQEAELFLNKIVILQSTQDQVTTQAFYKFVPVVDQSQVLNNFKVDKEIFNFFLRRQQLDYFKVNN